MVAAGPCGSSGSGDCEAQGSAESVAELRASLQEAAREVSALVVGPDVALVEAMGSDSTCGTEPLARMEYGAGTALRLGGDVLAQVRDVGATLAGAGWESRRGGSSVNLARTSCG